MSMRIYNSVFIAIFMAMLALPLLFVDLASDRISVQENRMLANFPELSDIKRHPETFIRGFDVWFKDSTGFREQMLIPYNVISKNKWLNNIWYTDGQYIYLIGEEGHHYFTFNGSLIRKFQGKPFLSDDQLTNMAAKLDAVKIYLDDKGIPLIVMFCTDKESVYPEFYPRSIKRGPEPIQLDVITAYLQENTGVDVFNIRQALFANKNNYLLYPLVDDKSHAPRDYLHFNEIGAFFTYRELMKHINVYFPQIIPYELNDVNIHYDGNGAPNVSLKAKTVYRKLDPSFFDDVIVKRPFTLENEAYENENPDLPVILFIRDSYTFENYFGTYFPSHFGKAIFIHYQNMKRFDEYIDKYKPDIVVFQSAERQLSWFADEVAGIPKLP